jgi:hypothetical protein
MWENEVNFLVLESLVNGRENKTFYPSEADASVYGKWK